MNAVTFRLHWEPELFHWVIIPLGKRRKSPSTESAAVQAALLPPWQWHSVLVSSPADPAPSPWLRGPTAHQAPGSPGCPQAAPCDGLSHLGRMPRLVLANAQRKIPEPKWTFPQSRGHVINLQVQGSSMPSPPSAELANELSLRVQTQGC